MLRSFQRKKCLFACLAVAHIHDFLQCRQVRLLGREHLLRSLVSVPLSLSRCRSSSSEMWCAACFLSFVLLLLTLLHDLVQPVMHKERRGLEALFCFAVTIFAFAAAAAAAHLLLRSSAPPPRQSFLVSLRPSAPLPARFLASANLPTTTTSAAEAPSIRACKLAPFAV